MKHIRSTLIISSRASLAERGLTDAYLGVLPSTFRSSILEAVAGVWVPIEVGLAHYQACDALGLSDNMQTEIGRSVSERVRGTLLGTVVRLAKGAGVSPITVMPQFQRFWNRAFDGGGVGVYAIGPKEARLDVQKVPLLETRYFRNGIRGLAMGVLDLFCTKSYVLERPGLRPFGTVSYRVQWA